MFGKDRTVYIRAYTLEGKLGVRVTKKAPHDRRDSDEIARGQFRLRRPIGIGPWRSFGLELEKDMPSDIVKRIHTMTKISVEFGIYDNRR